METKKINGIFKGISSKTDDRYKVQFLVDDKVWNFTAFKNWTKKDGTPPKGVSPIELKLEQNYSVYYREYQTENMEYPAKTATNFFIAKDQVQTTQLTPLTSQKPIQNVLPGIAIDTQHKVEAVAKDFQVRLNEMHNWDDFLRLYSENVDSNIKSVNHMIGTYIRSYFAAECDKLINACVLVDSVK